MFVILFLLWVIFNGCFTVEIAIFGVIIALAIEWFMIRFMDYTPKITKSILRNFLRIMQYVGILIFEIAKANVQVIRLIFNLKCEVEPAIIHFESKLKTDAAKVALANSITLTPGTITVSLEGNKFTVLCLDKDFTEGIDDSVFVKLLEKMEK